MMIHQSGVRRVAPILLLALAAACGREERREAVSSTRSGPACVSRAEGSRWAGTYRVGGVFGDTDEEALSGIFLAGIAATDSVVYVLELGRPRLWLLRPDLTPVRTVGREGRGPGEWKFFPPSNQGGSMGWVNADSTRVLLFDGTRVQEFGPEGRFRRLALTERTATGISFGQSRLRFTGGNLLYSDGGYDASGPTHRRAEPVGGKSLWRVRVRDRSHDRAVLTLGLVPIPRGRGIGPTQARPLWDARGACVVASDGAEPLLLSASVDGSRPDTAKVELPERWGDPESDAAALRGALPPGARIEQPTVRVRIRDLILDPDGYVWLLPVQPGEGIQGGVEVVRVAVANGRSERDTVPAFPRAFGRPGVFYAETYADDGSIRVVRYDQQQSDQRSTPKRPPEVHGAGSIAQGRDAP